MSSIRTLQQRQNDNDSKVVLKPIFGYAPFTVGDGKWGRPISPVLYAPGFFLPDRHKPGSQRADTVSMLASSKVQEAG